MAILENITNRLTQKLGPLPVWVWVGVPAGAYILYAYYKAEIQGEPMEGEEELAPVEDEFETGFPRIPGYDGIPDGSGNLPMPDPDPYTNSEWEQDAIRWALSQRLNALAATRAVTSYLHGTPATLNAEEMDILRQIITAKGPAPEGGTIPGGTAKPAAPKPAPTNVAPRPPGAINLRLARGKVQATWNPSPTAGVTYEIDSKRNRQIWRFRGRTTANAFAFESAAGTITVRVRAKNRYGYSPYVISNGVNLARAT